MKLIRQPLDSSLCGQACVAMAAGVSLKRAIEAVGHEKHRGTYTFEIVRGLRNLGVECAERCRRVSRRVPNLPRRAIVVIHRPGIVAEKRCEKWHWMLTWDGQMYDPGERWPEYEGWKITSYLEILCS